VGRSLLHHREEPRVPSITRSSKRHTTLVVVPSAGRPDAKPIRLPEMLVQRTPTARAMAAEWPDGPTLSYRIKPGSFSLNRVTTALHSAQSRSDRRTPVDFGGRGRRLPKGYSPWPLWPQGDRDSGHSLSRVFRLSFESPAVGCDWRRVPGRISSGQNPPEGGAIRAPEPGSAGTGSPLSTPELGGGSGPRATKVATHNTS
jgi:hypothetical protein